MRFLAFVCALLVYEMALAQLPVGERVHLYRTDQHALLQPPNDSLAMFTFRTAVDTVWDFSDMDTTAQQWAEFTADESDLIHGTNVRECRDGGDIIHYWNQSDSALVYRGAASIFSPTKDCDDEWRFDLVGLIYGNSEVLPLPQAELWSYDEFELERFKHVAGTPASSKVWGNYYKDLGVKLIDRKATGTLITPLDTFRNTLFIREIGTYVTRHFGEETTYDMCKGYWYHETSTYPIAIAYEWLRPLRDITGHAVSQLVEVQAAKLPEAPDPQEGYTLCRTYPNPFQDCFKHEFETVEDMRVFRADGTLVEFDQSSNEICLTHQPDGVYIVSGQCNGRLVHKRVVKTSAYD